MNRFSLILLLFFLSCCCFSLSTASESPSREEIILFSAAGFTNKSGSNSEQNDRAIEAARYLVIKKIEELFSERGRHSVSLPTGWSKGIRIINTIPFETAETSNLHGVRLLGRVAIPLPGNTPVQGGGSNRDLLETDFTSPKNIFYTGEEISFSLNGSRDFYACILDVNGQKEAIQLLPNSFRQNNSFTGGREYNFPDTEMGDNFRLEISPPYGQETIRLIASSYPITTILPIDRQDVFATSSKTFQELMLPAYDGITDSLMETGGSIYYQFVQVSIKTLSLKTKER